MITRICGSASCPCRGLAAAIMIAATCCGQAWGQAAEGAGLRIECGGIGEDEASRLRAEAGRHALMIQYVGIDGSYLADIPTRIDNPISDLRVEAACGPIALVDVAVAGRYRITATHDGRVQELWLSLKPAGAARTVLRWLD